MASRHRAASFHESESFPVFDLRVKRTGVWSICPLPSPRRRRRRNLFRTNTTAVTVEDPYQWLEKDDDPEVKAWSDAQNQRTRALSRQVAGSGGDREAIDGVARENFARAIPRSSRDREFCSR